MLNSILETIFKQLPINICCWRADGEINYVNDNYCQFYNKTRQELIGQNFFSLISEADHNKVQQFVAQLTPQNPTATIEHRAINTQSEICWHRWTYRCIFSEKGEPAEYISVGQDITNEKHTLDRISVLAQLALNSPHPIVSINDKGEILFTNKTAHALSDEFHHPGKITIASEWFDRISKVAAAGQPTQFEINNNEQIYAVTVLPSSTDQSISIYAADISLQKKNALKLLASEARFRALIQKETNGMLVVSEDGRILFANPSVERILGRSRESLLGLPFGLPILPNDTAEIEIPCQGGITVAQMRAVPLNWENQNACLVTLNDITENRLREQQLKSRNRKLKLLSQCNHTLVHAISENNLLQEYCHNMVNTGGYDSAWAGLTGPAGDILPVVWAGGDLAAVNQTTIGKTASELTPWIENAFKHQKIQQQEVRDSRSYGADSDTGWRLIIPLVSQQKNIGVLILKDKQCSRPDTEEISLLEELADDLVFGICSLRTLVAQKESEKRLHIRNRAMESTQNAIMITDARQADYPLMYVNPSFTRITGYNAEEALGRNPRFLHRKDRKQEGLEQLRYLVRKQEEGSTVIRNYHKDGSLFWNELHVAPVYDADNVLTHFVGVINDVSVQKRYQQELEFQATHDVLTGLPNRILLQDRLQQELNHAQREQLEVTLVVLDLDEFKLVNDSLGHPTGDALLCQVVKCLQANLRSTDTVARYGGDEFVMILPKTMGPDNAATTVQKLLQQLSLPVEINGHELKITASAGLSIYPQDSEDPDTLIQYADAAMYRAKEKGRNQFHFFTKEINDRVTERFQTEIHLRAALRENQFQAYYQPQVDLLTGEITGAEALIRWNHPEQGFILPGKFIPIAEKTGQIVEIGKWILEAACREATQWQALTSKPVSISVNLSAKQLADSDFCHHLQNVLMETGLAPELVEIELTESMIMHNSGYMRAQLDKIKTLGVHLAVDDFGTGYSSLAHLHEFSFDRIKLDISFVRKITYDPATASIARSVIALAKGMQLTAIAEGVETEAQLRYLQSEGCRHGQGFFFSRPLPADAFRALLHQGSFTEVPTPEIVERSILVLDDEINITKALHRLLRRKYKVYSANTASEAFEILALRPIQVAICDQRMPDTTGTDFLSKIKKLHPQIVRIILSGYTDLETITTSVNKGWIYKFITKPWIDEEFIEVVAEAIEQFDRNHSTAIRT